MPHVTTVPDLGDPFAPAPSAADEIRDPPPGGGPPG
jgi:hypothetical protein